MFHCRRNASGAALLLQRLQVTLPDASRSLRNDRCSRVYRRLTASKAVLFRSRLYETTPFGSQLDLVAHARMAAFALNAPAPRREYSDARTGDRNVLKLSELESFLSVRSSAPVAIQSRRSSTTPEKTQDERAANITQTVRQLSWSSDGTIAVYLLFINISSTDRWIQPVLEFSNMLHCVQNAYKRFCFVPSVLH